MWGKDMGGGGEIDASIRVDLSARRAAVSFSGDQSCVDLEVLKGRK